MLWNPPQIIIPSSQTHSMDALLGKRHLGAPNLPMRCSVRSLTHLVQWGVLFHQFSSVTINGVDFHSTSHKRYQLWQNHTQKKNNTRDSRSKENVTEMLKMSITKTNKYYSCSWANPKTPAIKKTKVKAYKKRKYTETFHNLYSDIHRWLIEKKTRTFGVVIALVGRYPCEMFLTNSNLQRTQ